MWKGLSLNTPLVSVCSIKTLTRLVAIVVISGTGLLIAERLARTAKSPATAPQISSQGKDVVPSQHLRFTVYPEGILPSMATAEKGLVSISIEDLAGTDDGVLIERVTDPAPVVVGTVRRFERHLRGRASVKLSPGTYRLRIAKDGTREALLQVEP